MRNKIAGKTNTRRIPVMLDMLREKGYSVTTENPGNGVVIALANKEPDVEVREMIVAFQGVGYFVFKK